MDVNALFGNRILKIRSELHITQEELALRCDINQAHLGQLEHGLKSPTLGTLQKIAEGIGVQIHELIDFGDELVIPNKFDETTNRIVARLQKMSDAERGQILTIVKTFR